MNPFARSTAALAIAFALSSAYAEAHDLGVSRMELRERDDGSFHAHFTFAAREADAAFDHDGHVALDLRTDDEPCAPAAPLATARGDGIDVDEDFACTKATRSIEAIAYFVTQMGASHEDVAIVETPEGTHEELLRAPHRSIVVELHRPGRESPHRSTRVAGSAARWDGANVRVALTCAAVGALALLGFVIRSILRK